MKFFILFLVLFSSLIVSINASMDNPYHHDSPSSSIPTKCEELYNATTCSECQQCLWDSWNTQSTCPFYLHLIGNIIKEYIHSTGQPYDLGPYNAAVKETCSADFTCKYEEAETAWKQVESKCQKELNTQVDWSSDPTKIDLTVASAYGTILFYYFGIPDHDSHCVDKSSSGELCGIDYIVPLVDWLKKEIPDGKFAISYDSKFVYKKDGSRLEIPRELITCGDCLTKMKKEYIEWPQKHPLPDYLVKNIYGSWEEVGKFYTCPKDSYKFRARKIFRRHIINTGLSHLAAASRFKF